MLKIILATVALALAAVLLFATMQPDTFRVTWAMEGDVPTIGKLIHRLFNMDRMIGTDFDSGLASLRAMAEGT